MDKFVTLNGIAAPLLEPNIDTDAIIPAPFLRSPSANLAEGLFFNFRFDRTKKPQENFILNREPFTHATVLVAGSNFGCGSSRVHAVWALQRFGFRCVIALSFGEIFYDNCFKNVFLPIILEPANHQNLLDQLELSSFKITIDLRDCIIAVGKAKIEFKVPAVQREALLQGLDEIGTSLLSINDIRSFRMADRARRPWVYDLESR
jgi:3-isopropylmalate/(R)-2-methylmalate dehydratase small subunit